MLVSRIRSFFGFATSGALTIFIVMTQSNRSLFAALFGIGATRALLNIVIGSTGGAGSRGFDNRISILQVMTLLSACNLECVRSEGLGSTEIVSQNDFVGNGSVVFTGGFFGSFLIVGSGAGQRNDFFVRMGYTGTFDGIIAVCFKGRLAISILMSFSKSKRGNLQETDTHGQDQDQRLQTFGRVLHDTFSSLFLKFSQ